MSDLTVILDRKELVVRMESKSIRVDRLGGHPERIPLGMVARVILIGSPMVSCDVWRALAEQKKYTGNPAAITWRRSVCPHGRRIIRDNYDQNIPTPGSARR